MKLTALHLHVKGNTFNKMLAYARVTKCKAYGGNVHSVKKSITHEKREESKFIIGVNLDRSKPN